MKKQNVLNLVKYHVEKNESSFRNEAILIAKSFDSVGDHQLAEYIMSLVSESNLYSPQDSDYEGCYLKKIDLKNLNSLNLPDSIADDIKGVINAINHNIGINKFLFEGLPGTGKTEAVKHVARLLERSLYYVDFDNLIDSKLGQTNKNIANLFDDLYKLPYPEKTVVLFDEIDVIALDRINQNDVREMGRVTSTVLRELDRVTELNRDLIIISTTNLYKNFDKALLRRFDAIINFNRYNREDLIEISLQYFNYYSKNFKNISRDTRLIRKILNLANKLPYPSDLKNLMKTSLAFSDVNNSYDYLKRMYNSFINELDDVTIEELYCQGFTVREIEKLTGESKSNVSRKLKDGDKNG